ncbi:hypothetical protein JCM6882_004294 [Rhodosporidiobolus microsporus]
MASFAPRDPSQPPPGSHSHSPSIAPSPSPAPPYDHHLALFQPTSRGEHVEGIGDTYGEHEEEQVGGQQQQADVGRGGGRDLLVDSLNNGGGPPPLASTSAFVFPPPQGIDDDALPTPPAFDPSLLPPMPSSPTAQIRLLRQMDEDADAALAANQAYRDELLEVMRRLDWARKRAGEVAALVTALQSELTTGAELKIVHEGFSEPALPWFKWMYGKDLPSNPDGEARDRYLSTIRSIPWSSGERAQLKQEVIAQNHRLVAQEALRRGEDLTAAIAAKPAEWYAESLEGIDWERIALVVDRRTPTECRIQYTQRDHPLLRHNQAGSGSAAHDHKWSDGEKARLVEVVEKFRGRDWKGIASELGTNRTPADCLRAWRRRPGQNKKVGGFTKDEDEAIREAVRLFGENWQAVARHTGLTSSQAHTRWTKSLRPTIKRGKWSAAEDAALTSAVAAVGKSWKEVEKRVGGRTDAQCRERWSNILDPRLKDKNEWTEEEEATLVRLRDEEGLSWAEIAKKGFDETRTDNHCMRRYTLVKRRALPSHLKPRIGRPPKTSRGTGRPKKSAKQKQKEEDEKRALERELDEMDRRDYEEWLRTEGGEGADEGEGEGEGEEEEEEEDEEQPPPLREEKRGRRAKPPPAPAGNKRKADALEVVAEEEDDGDHGTPQPGPSASTSTSTSTSTPPPGKNKKKRAKTPSFTLDIPPAPGSSGALTSGSATTGGGEAGKGKAKGKGKKRARDEEEGGGAGEEAEEGVRRGRPRRGTTEQA